MFIIWWIIVILAIMVVATGIDDSISDIRNNFHLAKTISLLIISVFIFFTILVFSGSQYFNTTKEYKISLAEHDGLIYPLVLKDGQIKTLDAFDIKSLVKQDDVLVEERSELYNKNLPYIVFYDSTKYSIKEKNNETGQ